MPAGNMQIQYGVIDNKSPDNIVMVESNTLHESYVHGNNYPNDIAVIKVIKIRWLIIVNYFFL